MLPGPQEISANVMAIICANHAVGGIARHLASKHGPGVLSESVHSPTCAVHVYTLWHFFQARKVQVKNQCPDCET